MIRINKRNKLIITLTILIIIAILYSGKFFLNNPPIDIPKLNDISTIELYKNHNNKYHVIEGTENIREIYNALLKSKKDKQKESVNDSPLHGYDIKIVLTDNAKNNTTLFLYNDNDKFYIESPYVGIYRISQSEYEIFTQFFTSN